MQEPDPTKYARECLKSGWISKVEVLDVAVVDVPPELRVWRDWPHHVVAARFLPAGENGAQIGAWAFELSGFWIAIDGTAREYTVSGAAASGDSTMGYNRDAAAKLPQVAEAKALVTI